MASTTFVNGATLTDEDWFNDLNRLHYTILGDPAAFGSGVATWLVTPSSANLATALTDESGTGKVAFELQGTWTPVLAFGGASVGITYSTQSAKFTKIGRVVFMECLLVLTSKGSSTGTAAITGNTYTAGSGSDSIGTLSIHGTAAPTGSTTGVVPAGATTINLAYAAASGGGYTALDNTHFTDTTTVRYSAVLMV